MNEDHLFDEETWEQLGGFLDQLPRPAKLVVWADANGSVYEQEALRLAAALAGRFQTVQYEQRPRQSDYAYYPLLGIMHVTADGDLGDDRVRFIGLPAGYQINGLVGAIQAVSFRASNLEGLTRIQLSRLPPDAVVDLELFAAAENEASAVLATLVSGFAVASPRVRAFIAMADIFPEAAQRYSVRTLPHLVINGRVHVSGLLDEEGLLRQIRNAVS